MGCMYAKLVDRILEELQRGLESPYKREIQRLLGIARLLSEVSCVLLCMYVQISAILNISHKLITYILTITCVHTYIHTCIHTYLQIPAYINTYIFSDVQLCGGLVVADIRSALPPHQLRTRSGRAARSDTHNHTYIHR